MAQNVSTHAFEVVSSRVPSRGQNVIDRELALQRRIKCQLKHHGLERSLLPPDCRSSNFSRSEHNPEISGDSPCPYLYGKTLLLLGDRSQHALHDLLLDHYPIPGDPENTNCPGADFCNWHAICPRVSSLSNGPFGSAERLAAKLDSNRKKQLPPDRQNVSILRYVRTYLLFPTGSRKHKRHNEPHVSRITGVRESESYWVSSVRGADVILLSKAPVLAPSWSYGKERGKQASTDPRPFRLRPPQTGDWELENVHYFKDIVPLVSFDSVVNSALDVSAGEILYSAVRATVDVWVPTLVSTLISILSDSGMRSKRFIWRGEWSALRKCGTEHLSVRFPSALDTLLGFQMHPYYLNQPVKDPWFSFHNSQVVFQSLILSYLLPRLGISYLPFYDLKLSPAPECPSADEAYLKSNTHLFQVQLPEEIGKTFIDTLEIALEY
ncbi:uncharacterized protein EI90DRAFT_3121551 [Cantharellus anzutake]|uniref:uncharacterized protein n=1 Tax=Cantharellus anzutake TaxID=1750568 RepID=UPI0019052411|nr:uncharacterized protein EI90DRAFT_3121551 [Cantharellus anzutake]KAF8334223.1 hypothetical protein EI90DRAFT_3121551 [Cantharellus anzutake]